METRAKVAVVKQLIMFCLSALCICLSPAIAYAGDGGVQGGFTVPDEIPPATVADLSIVGRSTTSLTLRWTAPGDDGNQGIATEYDIRYSQSSIITEAEWNVATQVVGEPAPSPALSTETFTVIGLNPSTMYWFALKTSDNVGNWSNLSNAAGDATLGGGGGGYIGGGDDGGDNDTPPVPQVQQLKLNILGEVTLIQTTEDSILAESREAVSPDRGLILVLTEGTSVIDREGNPADYIEVSLVTPTAIPPSKIAVGPGYEFQPYCKFQSQIKFVSRYDPQMLKEGVDEEDLVIAYYDQYQQEWIELPTVVDVTAKTVATKLRYASVLTILAGLPPLVQVEPVEAKLSNLNITASQVRMWEPLPFIIRTGEEVVITIDVVNTSDQKLSYPFILKMNGETKTSREITLEPKQSKQIAFTISDNQPGHYVVNMKGYTAEFTSSLWINWWLIGGIIGAITVIGLFIALGFRRREKSSR